MNKHSYKYFDKKQPTKTYSTSLGDVKDIDEIYKDLDLDEKNEVTTEPEVVERKVEVVKYKDKEYKTKEEWHDGVVTVLSNMRKEPSLDSNVLLILSPGATIKISKNKVGDFYKIKYNDNIGYLKHDLCEIK